MAEVLWLRVGQEWAQEDIGDTWKEAQGWAGAWTRAGPGEVLTGLTLGVLEGRASGSAGAGSEPRKGVAVTP